PFGVGEVGLRIERCGPLAMDSLAGPEVARQGRVARFGRLEQVGVVAIKGTECHLISVDAALKKAIVAGRRHERALYNITRLVVEHPDCANDLLPVGEGHPVSPAKIAMTVLIPGAKPEIL